MGCLQFRTGYMTIAPGNDGCISITGTYILFAAFRRFTAFGNRLPHADHNMPHAPEGTVNSRAVFHQVLKMEEM